MLRTIPHPNNGFLREMLVLEDYSVVDDAEGRRPRSRQTKTGARTSQAKYHSRSPRSRTAARDQLCCDLCEAAAESEVCAAADVVIGVPGHAGSPDAFSLQLGRDVAVTLRLPIVIARARAPQEPVKARHANLNGFYTIDEDLDDQAVLIVDDVYGTGGTIASVATASIAAGATFGIGLALAESRA